METYSDPGFGADSWPLTFPPPVTKRKEDDDNNTSALKHGYGEIDK